jgi:hypothetical protein
MVFFVIFVIFVIFLLEIRGLVAQLNFVAPTVNVRTVGRSNRSHPRTSECALP